MLCMGMWIYSFYFATLLAKLMFLLWAGWRGWPTEAVLSMSVCREKLGGHLLSSAALKHVQEKCTGFAAGEHQLGVQVQSGRLSCHGGVCFPSWFSARLLVSHLHQ